MLFLLAFLILFFGLWLIFLVAEPGLEYAIKRLAHRTAKFRYRDYVPVVLVLLIGIGATIAAGDAFEDLAELVQSNSTQLHAVDSTFHDWARDSRTSGATLFFVTMTIIGTPLPLGILIATVTGFLLAKKRWRWATYLVFTAGTGALLNLVLKTYFQRARPDLAEALRHATGFSFPSGHAMGATVAFGSLSYIAVRALAHWQWRWRAAAVALALSIIVAIASSRVYLGVHWISDIAAGIVAGFIWVTASTVAYETFRRIRLLRAIGAKRAASAN
jgi:membrane-associated phospholipid phosphatase